jgi:tetrahydrodipicolinate N-succinyltransferase
VLPGVTVGTGAVVAAGAAISKDVAECMHFCTSLRIRNRTLP